MIAEIEEFILDAVSGKIPVNKLTFRSNKVYKIKNNAIQEIKGTIGSIFSNLAEVNCLLWHEQEKVYEFEKVAISDKDLVVKQLATLNLQRTNCIDEIDATLVKLISSV